MDSDRVGLYVKPKTRDRLNLFKAALAMEAGCVQSQDDALNYLLDLAQGKEGDDRHQHCRGTSGRG